MQKFGKITFYNAQGAYGFVTPRGCDPRTKETNKFFHASMITLASYTGEKEPYLCGLRATDNFEFEFPGNSKGVIGLDVMYMLPNDDIDSKNVSKLYLLDNYIAVKNLILQHRPMRVQHRCGALPRTPKEFDPPIKTLLETNEPGKLKRLFISEIRLNTAEHVIAQWIESQPRPCSKEWQICETDPRNFEAGFLEVPEVFKANRTAATA